MDPHLHGQQPDAFDERERLFSGQRGRGGVLRPSQAGVLPQAQLRGRLDERVHQHAQRLHGLVPGQADQDGVRHEHHGSSTRARSCGMIGGDGINDESNKMSPAPDTQIYLTKDTGFSPNAELANRMLVKAAEGFFGRMKVEAFYPEH